MNDNRFPWLPMSQGEQTHTDIAARNPSQPALRVTGGTRSAQRGLATPSRREQVPGTTREEQEMTLSEARVAEIQRRIRDGTYNSREMADRLARTMLVRGMI